MKQQQPCCPSAKTRNACAIAKRPAARGRLEALAIAVQPNTIGQAIYNRPHSDTIARGISFALIAACKLGGGGGCDLSAKGQCDTQSNGPADGVRLVPV